MLKCWQLGRKVSVFLWATLIFFAFPYKAFAVDPQDVWVIAIDAGHGGQDPGAIGRRLKVKEKDVTFAIAKDLQLLLKKDPHFRPVLTRTGNYFISVPKRSEIARKHKAQYLISIHADSTARNSSARGASVWVLSNKRASSEMGRWLEDHEKRSELLGGAGEVFANYNEKYLNKTLLDLQFRHSQFVGYELGKLVLSQLKKITPLSRKEPQHASLGVLRSPDIPSILVETGFLSNPTEERLLRSSRYRKKIAQAIYQSLRVYYAQQMAIQLKQRAEQAKLHQATLVDSGKRYKVRKGDTLSRIASRYHISVSDLKTINKLRNNNIWVGQSLIIPSKQANATSSTAKPDAFSILEKLPEKATATKKIAVPAVYVVRKGDTLFGIAKRFNLSVVEIKRKNPLLKKRTLFSGQQLRLR